MNLYEGDCLLPLPPEYLPGIACHLSNACCIYCSTSSMYLQEYRRTSLSSAHEGEGEMMLRERDQHGTIVLKTNAQFVELGPF